jgi:hypothetical protein
VLPSPAAAVGVVLWIAATHAQPAWAHAPRLVIRAPEKRCGKSRLLDVIEALCWNPFITVNSSPAAVYRSITSDPPTLLVDEADTIFGPKADGNEDLRGLLNAGHQRNRPAKRYDAAANRVESIPTFAMAALAGIGAMPDTIEDRAVIIRMRRRAPGETVAPYRHKRDRPALRKLAAELNDWLRADLKALEQAAPHMPVEDRAADTWEPLIAVADHAGGGWPDRARAAVLALAGETADSGEGLRTNPAAHRLPHRIRRRIRATHHRPVAAPQGRPRSTVVRLRPHRPHSQKTRAALAAIRHPIRHHPIPWSRPDERLLPRRVRRYLAPLLPPPAHRTRPRRRSGRPPGRRRPRPGAGRRRGVTRTTRTNLITAGQPRYESERWYESTRTTPHPWYESTRTTQTTRTRADQGK